MDITADIPTKVSFLSETAYKVALNHNGDKLYLAREANGISVFDISDEKKPRLVSMFPEPRGNFCERGGRFGPHNVHENRPGAYCSDRFIYVTYFNAGLRVFDIDDPKNPQEIAYYLPPCPQNQKTIQPQWQ